MKDVKKFRLHIDDTITHFPELLPDGIVSGGYLMKDSRKSKKLQLGVCRS
jgi:hypothetical protein